MTMHTLSDNHPRTHIDFLLKNTQEYTCGFYRILKRFVCVFCVMDTKENHRLCNKCPWPFISCAMTTIILTCISHKMDIHVITHHNVLLCCKIFTYLFYLARFVRYHYFSILLAICDGIRRSQVDWPHEGPVKRNIGIFFLVCLNEVPNKQSSCP